MNGAYRPQVNEPIWLNDEPVGIISEVEQLDEDTLRLYIDRVESKMKTAPEYWDVPDYEAQAKRQASTGIMPVVNNGAE